MAKKKDDNIITFERPDFGSEYLVQHYDVQVLGEGSKRQARVLNHPLDRYHTRNEISDEQYDAGCRLFNDWATCHKTRNTMDLLIGIGRSVPQQADDINPHTAFERYMRAMTSLNHTIKKLAIRVCIEGFLLSEIRDTFPWSKRNTGIDWLGYGKYTAKMVRIKSLVDNAK